MMRTYLWTMLGLYVLATVGRTAMVIGKHYPYEETHTVAWDVAYLLSGIGFGVWVAYLLAVAS